MAQKDDIKDIKNDARADAEPRDSGTDSPSNRRKSPERPKEQSLGVHRDPYGPRKDRAS
jgi:hypothetical protein